MAKQPGLLLVTLGSPAEPTPASVRRFLTEFLLDPLVIDIPAPLRHLLVRGIIAPFRSPKSAEAYRQIWLKEGSPLMVYTERFAEKVKAALSRRFDVRWAARYGKPGICKQLEDWAIDELYVVPLYPQFALSSSQSALEEVRRAVKKTGRNIKLRHIKDFYEEPEFIQSQSLQIRRVAERFRPDHYLFSFHGLPVHHVQKLHPSRCLKKPGCCEKVSESNRWCYRAQSMATARALKSALGLSAEQLTVGFQSRLGRRPWIEPYTDQVLPGLVQNGVRRLLVSCPSFVADCLETLEEVEIRLKEQFESLGGQELKLVPALNDEDHWVQDFSQMMVRHNFPWFSEDPVRR